MNIESWVFESPATRKIRGTKTRRKRMEKWRDDDLNPHEQPTSFMVVLCARDIVITDSGFSLEILHVKTTYGNGFMPHVKVQRDAPFLNVSASGNVSLGTDESAYAAARNEGERMLQTYLIEIEEYNARAKRLTAKRASP